MALLDLLPSHILQDIISFTLCFHADTPPLPSSLVAAAVDNNSLLKGEEEDNDEGSSSIRFIPRYSCEIGEGLKLTEDANAYPSSSDYVALLLVNHHIHSVVAHFLHHDQPCILHLHAVLVNEQEMRPTWTYASFSPLPQIRNGVVDHVFVDFFADGTCSWKDSLFRGGDGGPPRIVWTFYDLLQYFLRNGPTLPTTKKTLSSSSRSTSLTSLSTYSKLPYSIKTLSLNFCTPTILPKDHIMMTLKYLTYDPTRLCSASNWHGRPLYPAGAPSEVLHPMYLLHYLRDEIGTLLGMSYHTAHYGAMMYECVGKVDLYLDGSLDSTIDIDEHLLSFSEVGPHQSFEKGRQAHFPTWRKNTLERRQELGLALHHA
eukprot:TRINITY_DN12446_c0_g1_i1.p1 TRINITY_DN12446_c0_g1~~TRINITY_DN12446_c0_g1_i1.p1  ORF type:complete len:380 (+),score=34.50 TRINITY_DN12446_c0_g1_i1:27-1142(+)